MTETILTDKPWRYDGFGCIRCGRHIVLQLPPSLADEVSPEEFVAIGKVAAAATDMLKALKATRMYVEALEKHLDPVVDSGAPTIREHGAMLRAAIAKAEDIDAQEKT